MSSPTLHPRQPLLPGFNPDPSIVHVDGSFYVVTSTCEYLPGIPIYRSADLREWEQIGNVITRSEQLDLSSTPTPGGVWAPTIRHRDGLFYVIVSVMFGGQGCILYTAADPAGPWSDGLPIPAVDGIDPDLAWDEDGTALVTFSRMGRGIFQVAIDPLTGAAFDEPHALWSGTGMHAPEGPHVVRHDDSWYLMIAEGGTERGHAVSVARSDSPRGPFEGGPANPVLTTRSTAHPIQGAGHADMVELPDGSTYWVLLGVRPVGFTRAFSPLGRETFIAAVVWQDGWPVARLLPLAPAAIEHERIEFDDPIGELGPEWLADRRHPNSVSRRDPESGELILTGDGVDLHESGAALLVRRVTSHDCAIEVRLDASRGVGGLVVRHSEVHWIALEAATRNDATTVTAIASLAGFERTWMTELPPGPVVLTVEFRLPDAHRIGVGFPVVGGDRITLRAAAANEQVLLAELDGRYWSFETTESFTGRVAGIYARDGEIAVSSIETRRNQNEES